MTWWATDTMVLNDKDYSIIKPMELVNFREDYNLDWEVYTTARNGCDATFIVKDNLLILDELSVYLGKVADYPMINGVKPSAFLYDDVPTYKDIGLRVKYTGMCLIGQNRVDFMKWKENIILEFKDGLLLEIQKSKKSTEDTIEWIMSRQKKPPLTVGDILDIYNRKT